MFYGPLGFNPRGDGVIFVQRPGDAEIAVLLCSSIDIACLKSDQFSKLNYYKT